MAVLPTTNPTLADLAKRLDPDGQMAAIVEILNQTNEVLHDIPWMEGNLPTGHRTTIRSGIPAPTWRRLYGGVQPTRSTTVPVTDNCGMMEAYSEVDKALADLAPNAAAFRLSEDTPKLEGMSQELAKTIFYGNEGTEPASFTGLAPRFNTVQTAVSDSADNVIDGGGTGSDNMSIWLIVWGQNSVSGIYPKGSRAGFVQEDLGRVTIENADGAGGRMEAYRTHYRWDCGLTVRDWRYIVRICNIKVSTLTKDAATGADLIDLMTQALEHVPSLTAGKACFYTNRVGKSFLRRQVTKAKNVLITQEEVSGKPALMFGGVEVCRVDQLLTTEARVT